MLAIIPARGGSKGLPGKNIKYLGDKPLIAYTIEAACASRFVSQVIVSTDDREIAETAERYGAEIPFLRNKELAADGSSAVDVYLDVIERLGTEYIKQPFIVLLPTTPFRTAKHVDEACKLFNRERAKTLVSVVRAEVPASWYLLVNKEGLLCSANYGLKNGILFNRQNNWKEYIPNGAIYILDYHLLKEKRTYYCERTIPYIMNRRDSVDIDTLEDFEYAEFILQRRKNMRGEYSV
jgi:N-acylneuraminate cytidylyltransferase/CMP-N,N'-diacetyllegionaminic acid synthase